MKKGLSRWWARIFIGWWALLLCVSSTNPFELFEVSNSSYLLFCLFIIFYFLGFAFFSPRKKVDFGNFFARSFHDYQRLINDKYFKFFLIFVSLVLLSYAYKYSQYIALAGSLDSRTARFETGKVFSSIYEILLFEYIIGALIWVLKFIVAFGIVSSASRNLAWVLSSVSCALYMSFGAGRNITLEVALLILFLMAARKYSNSTSNAFISKYKVLLFLVILYFASVLATFSRLSEDAISLDGFIEANSILLEHAIIYFAGSIRAFDYAYTNYQSLFLFSFGLLTASGLDQIFSLAFRFIGFDVMPYSNYWGTVLAQPIAIGDHHEFNALYTALFNFYFDFGISGVVINGFLFGIACSKILNLSIRRGGISLLFVSSMLFTTSVLSSLTWKLSSGPVVLILIIGLIHGLITRTQFKSYKKTGFFKKNSLLNFPKVKSLS